MTGPAETDSGPGRRRQTEPDLKIAENVFGDAAIIGLLDEWLIPAIVDRLLRDVENAATEETR